MKYQLIAGCAALLAVGSFANAAFSTALDQDNLNGDRQVARLVELINQRFPDSAASLKSVVVHIGKNGKTRNVEITTCRHDADVKRFLSELRQVKLGPSNVSGKAKCIRLTFIDSPATAQQ